MTNRAAVAAAVPNKGSNSANKKKQGKKEDGSSNAPPTNQRVRGQPTIVIGKKRTRATASPTLLSDGESQKNLAKKAKGNSGKAKATTIILKRKGQGSGIALASFSELSSSPGMTSGESSGNEMEEE